tara:strand:+ start:352 stop:600 length:249 start_codon:yes stop_codon:yes gene_type:complete
MAKTAAERKAEQRKRNSEYLKEMGAESLSITMYNGTLAALDRLKLAGGFEQSEEVITLLIHNADRIIKRDKSQLNNLTGINQ